MRAHDFSVCRSTHSCLSFLLFTDLSPQLIVVVCLFQIVDFGLPCTLVPTVYCWMNECFAFFFSFEVRDFLLGTTLCRFVLTFYKAHITFWGMGPLLPDKSICTWGRLAYLGVLNVWLGNEEVTWGTERRGHTWVCHECRQRSVRAVRWHCSFWRRQIDRVVKSLSSGVQQKQTFVQILVTGCLTLHNFIHPLQVLVSVLVPPGCLNKMPLTGWLINKFISHSSGGQGVQDQDASRFGIRWGPFSDS